jgi:stage V sporulation protein AB
MTMAGAVLGNIFQLFGFSLPLGQVGLGIYGLFAGIFLGGWILALAEMVNVFPIAVRRIKMKTGMPAVIISIAIAKALGSLVYFYKGF